MQFLSDPLYRQVRVGEVILNFENNLLVDFLFGRKPQYFATYLIQIGRRDAQRIGIKRHIPMLPAMAGQQLVEIHNEFPTSGVGLRFRR